MSRKELQERQSKIIFKDIPMWDSRVRENLRQMTGLLTKSCRKLVENKEFLGWLAAERFDLAFSHMYDICPIGLIHYAKIPSWIWLNSGALMDFVAYYIGVPIIPSYMPPIAMESSDHMNFLERTKSLIGHTLTSLLWKRLFADGETAIFRELIDPNFPDIVDVAKECPLVMVNSNELYDLPRPTLAKIVNIGGIGIQIKDAKPLSPEFQRIVDAAEGIVVFSFGSVAPSHKMPMSWKMAFVDAFKRFPRYHFIWRYEGTDLQEEISPNVHIFKWLPQADLLQNPKTKAFLSHGGYNSMQEAISAGVPLITIALFGDQPKNAKLAERHHFSVNLHKGDLSADTIADAFNKLFNDPSYSQKIKRLSQMARKKPVSASHLLVSWAEFVAEFKTLDNLVPAGNKLNFFQYHSLDVIAFLLFVAATILFVLWKTLKFVLLKLYCTVLNEKKEKKE
ncbi:UDP-glucoronosyl and UDP-glucosyl transferase [Ancylostoma caninum]|uniref:UDP-glucuronosyltransferase n=1 Tax=Ancylostoma caninum TaxID=29170 RepID=A0A368FLM1_ANCCA|nr:UDP-glucoronosyl and UDP-glucosyl transferase [Ancylostoma caninum]